jgi:hypothetical protein
MTVRRPARRRAGARRRRGLEGEAVLRGFADADPC